jgi:predicted hydrocarbon binding protein
MALEMEFSFDNKTYRHYMNGFLSVMHCHHYMTLLTKLSEKFDDVGGTRILRESAEDSVLPMFNDYIQKHGIASPEEKLNVGKEYYSVMGMGMMQVNSSEQGGGEVTLTRSHVDQGWIKKWDKNGNPINYWTRGYIAAMFASAFDKPARSYEVEEISSIVKGDETSKFIVKIK